jgi:plastocyanin
MTKNANFKIAKVIAAVTLAVIVMSITYTITAPETHLFAKKHKNSSSDSGSGSSHNDQTSSNDQSAASGGASETGNEVKIVGINHSNSFDPNPIEVRIGDTVTWTNDHHVGHTVTSISSEFNSGDIQPGQSFRHTFDKAGTFDYYCIIHPSMVGKVSVT